MPPSRRRCACQGVIVCADLVSSHTLHLLAHARCTGRGEQPACGGQQAGGPHAVSRRAGAGEGRSTRGLPRCCMRPVGTRGRCAGWGEQPAGGGQQAGGRHAVSRRAGAGEGRSTCGVPRCCMKPISMRGRCAGRGEQPAGGGQQAGGLRAAEQARGRGRGRQHAPARGEQRAGHQPQRGHSRGRLAGAPTPVPWLSQLLNGQACRDKHAVTASTRMRASVPCLLASQRQLLLLSADACEACVV